MSILVRDAGLPDVPTLVRLRLANAERHVQLDPTIYRVPDVEAVRRHFEEVLAPDSKVLILAAELAGDVVGMAEVILLADPPAHQILAARRAAEIHTVVLDGHRGAGIGAALVSAAQRSGESRSFMPASSRPTRGPSATTFVLGRCAALQGNGEGRLKPALPRT